MPLSLFQIPLNKKCLQAEFHPRDNSIIFMKDSGEVQCISHEGKENWKTSFRCEPVSFRISPDGDFLAVLGREKLFIHNLYNRQTAAVDVDEKITLMDIYKNTLLLSGFQDEILFFNAGGNILKSIKFDFLIRQFSISALTGHLIIYNQNRKLLCTDMDGRRIWMLENMIIHNQIQVSQRGDTGYFVLDPDDLIKFNVSGESFYEVYDERSLKCFAISSNGKDLLVLDSENNLVMYDENADRIWDYRFEHNIIKTALSPGGDFFLTVDNDGILTCYSTGSEDRERGDFFEIKDDNRVMDKEAEWTLRPGGYGRSPNPAMLTANKGADLFGLIGGDGSINFYNERGEYRFHTSFTAMVSDIGISPDSGCGYIFGGNEIMILDFEGDKKKYIIFENPVSGKPVVNYHQKKIFVLSGEKELFIYDFEGRTVKTVPLENRYKKGISCGEKGVVLYNDHEIKGISGEGKAVFKFPVKSGIRNILYSDPMLVYSSPDNSLSVISLSKLKGKKKMIKDSKRNLRLVSADPLFIISGRERLHHLDSNLGVISVHKIESDDSIFFIEDGRFHEIVQKHGSFYCYNDKNRMVWRYVSDEKITGAALMREGLVFIAGDSVRYIKMKQDEGERKHISRYLEF